MKTKFKLWSSSLLLFILTGCSSSTNPEAIEALDPLSFAKDWIFGPTGYWQAFKPVAVSLAAISVIYLGYNAILASDFQQSGRSGMDLTTIMKTLLIIFGAMAVYFALPYIFDAIFSKV